MMTIEDYRVKLGWTKAELARRGFDVHEVETGEFLKSGGSVFCLKAALY